MIDLKEHPEGCILPVRAKPGARKAGLGGVQNGALKVAVHAPPEQGKANKALVELLAEELQLKKSQVELLSGETSRNKFFLIRGVTMEKLRSILEKKCKNLLK